MKSRVKASALIAIVTDPLALIRFTKSIEPVIVNRKPGWIVCVSPGRPIVFACDAVVSSSTPSALKLSPSELPKSPPTLSSA